MKKKKEYRLYNMVLPFWVVIWSPGWWWLVLIPINYLIDTLVLYLCLRRKVPDCKRLVLRYSWQTCLFGFISDFIGAAFMLVTFLTVNKSGMAAHYMISSLGIIAAAFFIWLCNAKLTLLHEEIGKENANKVGIWLAVFTAPYLFLLPIYFS